MEDESIYDASVCIFDAKQELLKKINQKLLNSPEKSVLILLDNFNYLFTSSNNFKISLEILTELFSLKKKIKNSIHFLVVVVAYLRDLTIKIRLALSSF